MGLLTTLKQSDVFRDEKSLAFDGTNDYLDCALALASGTTITVSCWLKPAGTTNDYMGLVGAKQTSTFSYEKWLLRRSNANKYQFFVDSVGVEVASTEIEDGIWHNLCATYDGSTIKLYLDGILKDSASESGHNISTDVGVIIGQYMLNNNTPTFPYNGNISEVAIYNSALTANQVKTIYNGREPYNHKEGVASGNLQAWYRMGDGSLDKNSFISSFLICDETNATLGNNMVTNGTFASDSDWTKGTGWTIGSGVATASSIAANELSQDISAVTGKIYKVSVDLTSYTQGLIYVDISGSAEQSTVFFAPGAPTGYYEAYVKATGSVLRIYSMGFGGLNFIGSIDNVKVQLVNGNAGIMTSMGAEDIEGDTP